MNGVPILDLITTPVAVLNGLGLKTSVGLSADDPLGTRHIGDRYRTFVTYYAPDGSFFDRCEFEELDSHERRLADLSAPATERFGPANCLAVVHRVPTAAFPLGVDPSAVSSASLTHGDYTMFRAMVQYGLSHGGHGGVIYETPPNLNDLRARPQRSTTLTFSSKIALSRTVDTVILLLHASVDTNYRHIAKFRYRLHAQDGAPLCEGETAIPAFTARCLSIRELLADNSRFPVEAALTGLASFSLVGWSTDAALLTLFIHMDASTRSVAVEHSHPPQTYLLPADNAVRGRLKSSAVDRLDKRFGLSVA